MRQDHGLSPEVRCVLCSFGTRNPRYGRPDAGGKAACDLCEKWHWKAEITGDEFHEEHLRAYGHEHAAETIVSQHHEAWDYCEEARIQVRRSTGETFQTFNVTVKMEPSFNAERVDDDD